MLSRFMGHVTSNVADNPAETGGFLVMAFMASVIAANALWLQPGQHPAPLFSLPAASSILGSSSVEDTSSLPARRAAAPKDQLVLAIQELLTETGHYTGTVDGLSGPATISAIKAFERETGLPVTGTPSFSLLADIENQGAANNIPGVENVSQETFNTSGQDMVVKVQAALKSAGYELSADGIVGPQTIAAIKTYQENRGMKVDGEISQLLIRDLFQMGDYSIN